VAFRRIGHNETTAIRVCDAFAAKGKQPETQSTSDDAIVQYAERLASAPRAHDDELASVTAQGERFHGYFFHVLAQPAHASTKKRAGVAVVAYPEEYRASGVMTFIVTRDGRVYERDLGPDTAKVARTLETRPASGWSAVSSASSGG
jgi:hypothetical protein